MSQIAYFRVSTLDQSIDAQRAALKTLHSFDREFSDEGISGAVPAMQRSGFASLFDYVREADIVYVSAVDRLGRDAIDVQQTIRSLIAKGVSIHVEGLGIISKGAGEIVIAVLAQVADLERQRIAERTAQGRRLALESLATTGKTHRGKSSLGRPKRADSALVKEWKEKQNASISETAKQFNLSTSTVKRYCGPNGGNVGNI